jgi:GMP synthase (glutamine-hydrolysing)
MRDRPLLVVRTGTTVDGVRARRGDFADLIATRMKLETGELATVSAFEGEPLPPPADLRGVVVTGSSAMVTDRADWSVACGRWLARAVEAEVPILGICYGHQLLADALGGEVAKNPRGREIGTIAVELTPEGERDEILGATERVARYQSTHVESVVALPPGAVHLARSDLDPFQAFRVGSACCVQFHPEFDADVIRGYIAARADRLRAEGLDPEALARDAADTESGATILSRFRELCDARC